MLSASRTGITITRNFPPKIFQFDSNRQIIASNQQHTQLIENKRPLKRCVGHEEKEMKKRWMKSIVETSKAEAPVLPFNRAKRFARKPAPALLALKRKTA